MPNDDVLDQYKMIGEGVSNWLIAMLLLSGSVGAVASVVLLLPTDPTIDRIKSWVIPSSPNSMNINPQSSLGVKDDETGTAASVTHNDAILRPADPRLNSRDGLKAVRPEATPTAASSKPDETGKIPSVVGAVGEKAISVQKVSGSESRKDGQRSTSVSADSDTLSHSVASAKDTTSSSMPVVNNPKAVSILADFAAVESRGSNSIEVTPAVSAKKMEDDCPPLFAVHFDRDGTRPVDQDLSVKVNRIHTWLNMHPDAKVIIEGHTDSYGAEEWNLLVSHRRAKVVAKVLASVGVPERQMELRALGEYAPVIGLPPESARNRRVSLRIRDGQGCVSDINQGDNP